MLKKVLAVGGCLVVLALLATPAMAFESGTTAPGAPAPQEAPADSTGYLGLALAFGLGIAAFGGALGQGNAIAKSVDAVARQPEAGARIQTMMIIGLALIETLVIYMLLICFMWGGKIPGVTQ